MSESDLTWWLARGEEDIDLLPGVANRHGLIAGATGTGKKQGNIFKAFKIEVKLPKKERP